jgi:cell division protein FtsZ
VIDDALGDEVRVTVIAAGFDRIGTGAKEGRLARVIESDEPGEREPVPSLLQDEDEDELFRSAPATVVFDAEEDLDIPDFLKS